MSRRTERIASLIRDLIADAIQTDLSDPRIEPLTSITRVEVTPDLSLARIHVSVLAPPARQTLCVRALRHAAGRLRTLAARELVLRQAPRLEFHLDESLQRGFETMQAIEVAMSRTGTSAGPASEPDTTPHAGEPSPLQNEDRPSERDPEDA
jgi:ribosome-binding factor A